MLWLEVAFYNSVSSNIDCEEEADEDEGETVEDSEDEGQQEVSTQPGDGAKRTGEAAQKKARCSQADFLEKFLERKEAREQARQREVQGDKDGVQHFLLGLVPWMKRLAPEKQSSVRLKMTEVLREAEFGAAYQQQGGYFHQAFGQLGHSTSFTSI